MKVSMMTEHLLEHGMNQKEAIAFAKRIGFDGIDISLFICLNDKDEMMRGDYLSHARELKKYADSLSITPVQAHTPFPIHRDNDDAYNEKMIEVQKKCLEICGVMEIPFCVIHPWNNWTPKENKEWYMKLYPIAEKNHVTIATENMWNWNLEKDCAAYASCSTPEDFLANCKEMNLPYFKACVDLGHANMFFFDKSVTPERMIRVLGHEYVSCLHVHENHGRYDEHEIPFTGRIHWEEVITALKEIHYEGNIDLELAQRKDAPIEILEAYFRHGLTTANYIRSRLIED